MNDDQPVGSDPFAPIGGDTGNVHPAAYSAPAEQNLVPVNRWLLSGLVGVAAIATLAVVALVVALVGRDSTTQPVAYDPPPQAPLPTATTTSVAPTPTETTVLAPPGVEEVPASTAAPTATRISVPTRVPAPAATVSASPQPAASAAPAAPRPSPASTTKPPVSVPPAPASVGSTVPFTLTGSQPTSGTVTLNSIRRITTSETAYGGKPTSGSYLIANFTVAISSGTTYISPSYSRAQTPDGSTYSAQHSVVNQEMDRSDLSAGRMLRGDVAFDVPQGSSLLLDFGGVGSSPLATFRVTG
ncbi:DUF4352 domain-containing protein [Rhodococcus sp. X156]|uniref:DUF4352 domain-containing protein n=1 Tax=Rhodococcus sp. X156 TaxID=2499145 RepID=UPI000FD75085|nr:DUF4352 domain-containing protein [Rhodococcus sp. X156]